MTNTLERKIADVNDSVTDRLDDLETSLPTIPSKALAAGRANARWMNDVIENLASSIWERFETVGNDASAAAKTSTGQARSAAETVSKSVTSGAAQTRGQAAAASKAAIRATRSGVKQTSGQARAASERAVGDAKTGVKQSVGQAKAQAGSVGSSVTDEIAGALDDAKVATDPDRLADLTKAELYDRATKLDIDGRSSMTKAELIGAIQKS